MTKRVQRGRAASLSLRPRPPVCPAALDLRIHGCGLSEVTSLRPCGSAESSRTGGLAA